MKAFPIPVVKDIVSSIILFSDLTLTLTCDTLTVSLNVVSQFCASNSITLTPSKILSTTANPAVSPYILPNPLATLGLKPVVFIRRLAISPTGISVRLSLNNFPTSHGLWATPILSSDIESEEDGSNLNPDLGPDIGNARIHRLFREGFSHYPDYCWQNIGNGPANYAGGGTFYNAFSNLSTNYPSVTSVIEGFVDGTYEALKFVNSPGDGYNGVSPSMCRRWDSKSFIVTCPDINYGDFIQTNQFIDE